MIMLAVALAVMSSVAPVMSGGARLLHVLQAQETPRVLEALPGSTLTIRGSTSIGAPWHCTARTVSARVAVMASADSLALPDVRGIALHVPVSALKCQSGPMERMMRKTIRADVDTAAQYISGRFDIQDDASAPRPDQRFLYGAIKVAGTARNIFLDVTINRLPDGTLHAKARVPLALTDFGMAPPRVLFGIVRAKDAVVVEVDLRYRLTSLSSPDAPPPAHSPRTPEPPSGQNR